MPSPFPGMDPYLEGYLWSDVHSALANKIRQVLVPLLRPRYTARLEIYLVEDNAPEAEVGILYPDVEVLQVRAASTGALQLTQSGTLATTPAQLTLPVLQPVEIRVPTVEIRDTALNVLVTCIEILSPVNKREPGLTGYRQKRQRLYQAGVNLIELDLLRRGSRPFNHPRLPNVPYLIELTRASSGVVEVWTLGLQDRLPVIPVPLRQPDPDVPLDLAAVFNAIYDEAAYDLSIDYRQAPPPPPLSESDALWLENLLAPLRG
ncbi:MAG: hypothetical protein CLLPBCKN_006810 [Chroococcidiopsis cubana SAG 39.79]|uniref:DUF4058 domain-containing protein n=1 Tax=Chroococcidiopsis cubana SAG 39.79 TaxID=388085 RepID=A0AB37UB13_9CYAN|nr:DUF4058 family protein [Chroococcidiopsis cubana]MDZ4877375.1 hypothetical protein [Chroococcidiopsis cubana SAG 39.79]PSB62600.1 hypothetical protein C7B79_17285 [Chroococcidiopsis cubana CCALA 043]RUT01424.1 hypothetical protein DSM107010_65520 [Chroococcidiopsis cubana SAG 39.79]